MLQISDQTNSSKRILNEIVIIRVILVFLLVLYHSFAPYSNAWSPLSSDFIAPYYWISKFSYSFFLGSFVFISGYLYGFAELKKGTQPISTIIKKKSMRLIVPSLVFSTLYLLIFGLNDEETSVQAFYSIIEGRGHMWFLPMLFWLFMGIELLKHLKVKPKIIIVATFVLSIISIIPLPFRINLACQYLILFYLGYLFKTTAALGYSRHIMRLRVYACGGG